MMTLAKLTINELIMCVRICNRGKNDYCQSVNEPIKTKVLRNKQSCGISVEQQTQE